MGIAVADLEAREDLVGHRQALFPDGRHGVASGPVAPLTVEEQATVAGKSVGGVVGQLGPAAAAQLEIEGQPPIEAPAQAVGAGGLQRKAARGAVHGPGRSGCPLLPQGKRIKKGRLALSFLLA